MNTKYIPVSAYINKDFIKALKIIKSLVMKFSAMKRKKIQSGGLYEGRSLYDAYHKYV